MNGIENVAELRQTLMDACDILISAGYSKPLTSAELSNKKEITETISLHYALLQSICEMDQLKRGLNVLGIVDYMKEYPLFFSSYFMKQGNKKLMAGTCIIYNVVLSHIPVTHLQMFWLY